ncbi:MAG: hypothetical protein ABSE57_17600 [Bryobacteraceae bacterium]|jgi:glucose/arabinose dehydrogenase
MTTRRPSQFAAGLLLAFFVQQSPTRAQDAPQILDSKDGKIRVVPVATDLFHPWSLAFADARTLLVTERNGRLRVIRDGALLPEAAWTSPTPPGESGDSLRLLSR